MLNAKNNEIQLKGSSEDKRELMYIDDLTNVLLKLNNNNIQSGVYNLGTGRHVLIKDIINYINKKNKNKIRVRFLKKKSPKFSILDTSKMKRIIKLNIKNKFFKNLDKTIEFVQKDLN